MEMNGPVPGRLTDTMKPNHVLIPLLLFLALIGGISERYAANNIPEPMWWVLLSTLLCGAIIFYWYVLDSNARGYHRSKWLNIGVVALAVVAVPYYLVRSRPAGQKGKALLKFLGFGILLWIATAGGAVLVTVFL